MDLKNDQFRVRKGASVYGPMSRANLDKLLASGRIAPADEVSVRDAAWIKIEQFLATAAPEPPPAPRLPAVTAPASGWQTKAIEAKTAAPVEKPCLQVAKDERKFPPMTRQQVEKLFQSGRLTADDLICVIDGPWMLLADFFGTRQPLSPAPRPAPADAVDQLEVVADHLEEEDEHLEEVDEVLQPNQPEPYQPEPPPLASLGTFVPSAYSPQPVMQRLPDQWYAMIRGLHSMNLQKHHLKTLLAIKEINPGSQVRHPSWDETDWRALRDVPQLADLVPS